MSRRILCIAGELSGDRLLARAVRLLTQRSFDCVGLGGSASVAAGLTVLGSNNVLNSGGIIEVIPRIPSFLRLWKRLKKELAACDGLLVVDTPELGMRLIKEAARIGRPSMYLAPPQAWAWRGRRVRDLRQATWVGCNFGFEADWFKDRGVPAHLIGHPFARLPTLPEEGHGIAVLPGSRSATVARLLRRCLPACGLMASELGGVGVHLSTVPGVPSTVYDCVRSPGTVSRHEGIDETLRRCRLAVVGAGTASLQAVCLGRPVVIVGAVHPVSAAIGRWLIDVPHFGLPNLLVGKPLFPELIQEQLTQTALMDAIRTLALSTVDWSASIRAVQSRLREEYRPEVLQAGLSMVFGA